MLSEVIITKGIVDAYFKKLTDHLDVDVAIVGGGPSGLVAGHDLAKAGKKVALFESKLSIGGGIWGGGMGFNEIVVQEASRSLVEEFGLQPAEYEKGYYTLDSVHTTATLIARAMDAGLTIFNLITMEDVVIKGERVAGLVLNWGAIQKLEWHIDPLTIHSRFVLDATGHPSNVVATLVRKMNVKLNTSTGGIVGEKSMAADTGELETVANTREVFPGLYVSGMAANAVYGGYRMGPVFGGMLLSGRKAAASILEQLNA